MLLGKLMLILLLTDSNELLMQKRGPHRKPEAEADVVPITNRDGATVPVTSVIHQDVDPELGKVPDLEGYHQREVVRDVKLGDELPEDQHGVLKDLIQRNPIVFTDMPRKNWD